VSAQENAHIQQPLLRFMAHDSSQDCRPVEVIFPGHGRALAIKVQPGQSSASALKSMGLAGVAPTMVILGGAAKMSEADLNNLQIMFDQVLAPLAQSLDITVIDGGTDTGVIRKMGLARLRSRGNFRLIGVAPEELAILPGQTSKVADELHYYLEPNHTHFFLVPGEEWGSESSFVAELASSIASHLPSLSLVINGGTVTLQDLRNHLEQHRQVVVVSGTGRLADLITAIAHTPHDNGHWDIPNISVDESEVKSIVSEYLPSGKLSFIDLNTSMPQMMRFIRSFFDL